MHSQLVKREEEFLKAIKKSEREIMNSFKFKSELDMGVAAHSSLKEIMSIDGEYVGIEYDTEFSGHDVTPAKKHMRPVDPSYSTDP